MFYPVETLKRGGKFYLCWVADSWPLRFATITLRQLWSYDIRQICDDLLEVITNESGRPTNRFSLRLSSQLLRGLVRLYQRKAASLLGDLCMINATVIKNLNKKYHPQDGTSHNAPRQRLQVITTEHPEDEPRVEELIQSSKNVVANIDDITLKEPTIPEIQFLINDGFGELRLETRSPDRTVELMLQGTSAAQLSALEPVEVSGDKSHDKSRAAHDLQMERISEYDVSMYRKSIGVEISSIADIEKEIPEIPEIPPPVLNVPEPMVPETALPAAPRPAHVPPEDTRRKAEEHIVLEELEQPQPKRRRARTFPIIDKKTRLASEYLRSRIGNLVELRCESSMDDVINIRVPSEVYLLRPAAGGAGGARRAGGALRPNISRAFTPLYLRNLELAERPALHRESEEAVVMPTPQVDARSKLDQIGEEPSSILDIPQIDLPMEVEGAGAEVNVTAQGPQGLDFSDLPTQVVEILPQRKRTSEFEDEGMLVTYEVTPQGKRRRGSGFVSLKLHKQQLLQDELAHDGEKENIPENVRTPLTDSQRNLTELLRKAGLADIEPSRPPARPLAEVSLRRTAPRCRSSSDSETPLGSLDRTKVSLGDTDATTDSRRFIRDHWGTEGTMVRVLCAVQQGRRLDVPRLVSAGPVLHSHKNIITARCFTSLLKLKQHGFVNLVKDPVSLAITEITLGPKFDVDAD